MAKGDVYRDESIQRTDVRTGSQIRQATSHPSIHHPPFYYLPPFDDGMNRLFFVSHRTGTPQIFCELRSARKLVQLTDRSDLNEWSLHPAYSGKYVYYTSAHAGHRVDVETLVEEELIRFPGPPICGAGMVGGAMGTTSLSRDERWWAITVKTERAAQLFVLDLETGACQMILERNVIAHPEFHPDDPTLLRYAGPHTDRLWVIGRDGSDHKLAYQRDAAKKEWIVHETWMPGRRELLVANWPHGVLGVDIDTGAARTVCRFNAWHPMIDRTGQLMVADTNHPDVGLQLFNPLDGIGAPRTLCYPGATNAGAHWMADHCPYDDGPVDVYAPQHTHPHPNFSPDGSRIVYTSDAQGTAQIYEVALPP